MLSSDFAGRMRRGSAVGAVIALLAIMVPAADAQTFVWYRMISGNGVEVSGGPGQRLVIETDANPGPHDFVIRMTAAFQVANSVWSLDLLEFEGLASVTSVTYLGPYAINAAFALGGHPVILDNAGQIQLFLPPVSFATLMEFDLRVDALGGAGITEIFSGIGSGGWAPSHPIQFGDATPIDGWMVGAIADAPSIEIRRVPEPRTFLLVLCVALTILAAKRPRIGRTTR